jgi:hypothetical protein
VQGGKAGEGENSSWSGTRLLDQEVEREGRRSRGLVAGAGRSCAREFVVVEGCLVSFAASLFQIYLIAIYNASLGPETMSFLSFLGQDPIAGGRVCGTTLSRAQDGMTEAANRLIASLRMVPSSSSPPHMSCKFSADFLEGDVFWRVMDRVTLGRFMRGGDGADGRDGGEGAEWGEAPWLTEVGSMLTLRYPEGKRSRVRLSWG